MPGQARSCPRSSRRNSARSRRRAPLPPSHGCAPAAALRGAGRVRGARRAGQAAALACATHLFARAPPCGDPPLALRIRLGAGAVRRRVRRCARAAAATRARRRGRRGAALRPDGRRQDAHHVLAARGVALRLDEHQPAEVSSSLPRVLRLGGWRGGGGGRRGGRFFEVASKGCMDS